DRRRRGPARSTNRDVPHGRRHANPRAGDSAGNHEAARFGARDFPASREADRRSGMPGTSHLHSYALSLGSNRPLSADRPPARLLREVTERLAEIGRTRCASPLFTTPPLGPSRRLFTNGALLLETALPPEELLRELQKIERIMGRRRFRRWG